jgi:hypothetical protein
MGEKGNAYRILVGSQKERDHEDDQDVGGQYKNGSWRDRMDGMDWINVAQDRDQCMALVSTVMNLRVA